jgi:hypothetical protein
MKLTRMQVILVAAAVVVLAGLIVIYGIKTYVPPPGTPIIIAGGSIKAKTWHTDPDGWTPVGQLYSATVHGSPGGIDYLVLKNFNPPAPGPLTLTGGWAVTVANVDPVQTTGDPNALRLCSDQTCSASHTLMDGTPNPSPCTQPFSSAGPAYVGKRSGTDFFKQMAGPIIRELHLHDNDKNCGYSGGDNDSKCDNILTTMIETCKLGTFTCNAGNDCQVTVGQ